MRATAFSCRVMLFSNGRCRIRHYQTHLPSNECIDDNYVRPTHIKKRQYSKCVDYLSCPVRGKVPYKREMQASSSRSIH